MNYPAYSKVFVPRQGCRVLQPAGSTRKPRRDPACRNRLRREGTALLPLRFCPAACTVGEGLRLGSYVASLFDGLTFSCIEAVFFVRHSHSPMACSGRSPFYIFYEFFKGFSVRVIERAQFFAVYVEHGENFVSAVDRHDYLGF